MEMVKRKKIWKWKDFKYLTGEQSILKHGYPRFQKGFSRHILVLIFDTLNSYSYLHVRKFGMVFFSRFSATLTFNI